MRDRWSNDQKSHDRGKQNDCAKTSATWRHDFLFAKIGEKLRESWPSTAEENYTEAGIDC